MPGLSKHNPIWDMTRSESGGDYVYSSVKSFSSHGSRRNGAAGLRACWSGGLSRREGSIFGGYPLRRSITSCDQQS